MKLLADFESKKIPYQGYAIQHGIETIHIQIPLRAAPAFEKAFREAIQDGVESRDALIHLAEEHGGKIRQ